MSSLSWYFLNLFGLKPVYQLILGSDNGKKRTSINTNSIAASQDVNSMGGMPNLNAGQAFAPGQDPAKMMETEAENLEIVQHDSIYRGIESRVLAMYS